MAHITLSSTSLHGVRTAILLSVLGLGSVPSQASEAAQQKFASLSLEAVVKAVQVNDPWLVGDQHSQDAIDALSIAAGTLPDPKISIGLANLATDGFDFDQEAMTQIKVGISQMFPRGDSLVLRKKQLQLLSSQHPYQRQDRKALIAVNASKLWLDAYNAQESIALIEKYFDLFEQLADVAQASYSAAIGRIRQQDIIRAQLELTTLDDRLTILKQKQEMFLQKLSEWLSDYFLESYSEAHGNNNPLQMSSLRLEKQLPDIVMINEPLYMSPTEISPQLLYEHFSQHPVVKSLEQKIKTSSTDIELAKQKYKPEWGINASYGYRDDDPLGNSRADLFSVGVTLDLPLFTANRQDMEVQSAVSRTEAVKTEKWLLIRRLIASFEAGRTDLLRLNERREIYRSKLLPQMHDQAEASLTAYTNDDGDFAEAVRSRIAELNAKITALSVDVDRQKAIVQLNYFFMTNADDVIALRRGPGDASGEGK